MPDCIETACVDISDGCKFGVVSRPYDHGLQISMSIILTC